MNEPHYGPTSWCQLVNESNLHWSIAYPSLDRYLIGNCFVKLYKHLLYLITFNEVEIFSSLSKRYFSLLFTYGWLLENFNERRLSPCNISYPIYIKKKSMHTCTWYIYIETHVFTCKYTTICVCSIDVPRLNQDIHVVNGTIIFIHIVWNIPGLFWWSQCFFSVNSAMLYFLSTVIRSQIYSVL